MTIASYTELVSEMGDFLDRADLTAKIPTFIRLFEARMNRRLRSPEMEARISHDTIEGENTYAMPSTVRELRTVSFDDVPLAPMTPAVFNSTFSAGLSGTPLAYTVMGGSIILGPVPSDGSTLSYTGYVSLSGLNSGNTTNWLLDAHPDLYLFGSLARAEAYLKDDERVMFWKAAEDEALEEVVREGNKKRLPAGPLVSRPAVIESASDVSSYPDPQ